MSKFFLGIDVGTGSARAGIFREDGTSVGIASHPIQMWKPEADFVEQSSDDIWHACGRAVKGALKSAGLQGREISGIGFDATCSLVVLDDQDKPVSVSPDGRDQQNVIVWMDHRAMAEAAAINASRDGVLTYVGGKISPEMQIPKLRWLKRNLPKTWKRAAKFLDLPDFLTYRATGDETRSLCTTVCKWTYVGDRDSEGGGWSPSFFRKVGLGDLVDEQFRRIGTKVRPMGAPLGHGFTERAAADFGLEPGTPVAVGMIDAHAGGLGLLGSPIGGKEVDPAGMEKRLALIGGTSSCHMAVSRKARFIEGVWGPYFSAMIPGMWLTEGGQSITGALIDHVIQTHPAVATWQQQAKAENLTIYQLLNARLEMLANDAKFPGALTADLHVLSDFHGNRSPRADPSLKGMIAGLTLDVSADSLALLYLATIQSVAYGTRHIIEAMNQSGYAIRKIFACGGGTKNPVFLREHADITGCDIVLPKEPEAVLLGAAVQGAVASGTFGSLLKAMNAMNAAGEIIKPTRGAVTAFHDAKYQVFHRMHEDFMAYRGMMES